MTALTFDPTKHEYALGGKKIVSVTTVIRQVIPPSFLADPYFMTRGTATHLACEYADAGKLAWDSVHPEIMPRVQAWQKFRADWSAEIVLSEEIMAHPTYGFAGKPDRIFLTADGDYVVCDLKNSINKTVIIQLAGYRILFRHKTGREASKAVAVHLCEDGSYRCVWFTKQELKRAESVFLGCLSVYAFKLENGLLDKEKEQ